MLQGIDLSQRIDFVSEFDKGEVKTVFVFKPLSGIDAISLTKFAPKTADEANSDYIIAMLGMSVVEIKNPDITEKEKIVDFILSLQPMVFMELLNKSNEINKLSENETKNS